MSVQGKLNQFKKIQTVCSKITTFKGQKADCNKNRASVVKQTPNGNKFCRYFKDFDMALDIKFLLILYLIYDFY